MRHQSQDSWRVRKKIKLHNKDKISLCIQRATGTSPVQGPHTLRSSPAPEGQGTSLLRVTRQRTLLCTRKVPTFPFCTPGRQGQSHLSQAACNTNSNQAFLQPRSWKKTLLVRAACYSHTGIPCIALSGGLVLCVLPVASVCISDPLPAQIYFLANTN